MEYIYFDSAEKEEEDTKRIFRVYTSKRVSVETTTIHIYAMDSES